MNHLRALQSGLGSLDRLEAELTRKECERDQFEQLREDLIDRADLGCSCRRLRPGRRKPDRHEEKNFAGLMKFERNNREAALDQLNSDQLEPQGATPSDPLR